MSEFAHVPRPALPMLTELNTAFWQSGQYGELRITRCHNCGYYIHPGSSICPKCLSRDVAPEAVSGKATVATFTINHQVWERGLEEPYVVAIVELPEQTSVRLTTNIVNCPIEAVHIGMRVRVIFDHREDVWLPLFEPDPDV
jgi:uncharacterized OB-fold protein